MCSVTVLLPHICWPIALWCVSTMGMRAWRPISSASPTPSNRPSPSSRRCDVRSEEHTSELQSHSDLHSFPTRRSSDRLVVRQHDGNARLAPDLERLTHPFEQTQPLLAQVRR